MVKTTEDKPPRTSKINKINKEKINSVVEA